MVDLDFLSNEYRALRQKTNRTMLPWSVLSVVITVGVPLTMWAFSSPMKRVGMFYSLFFGGVMLLIILRKYYGKAESMFWEMFARKNNGVYGERGDIERRVSAVLFRQGFKREIGRTILFAKGKERLELYEYTYYTEHTDSKGNTHITPHPFTVFDITYEGKTPHLCLNYRKDFFNIFEGKKISLPHEFEKRFTMYVPEQYEIEALTIFTPEILQYMLDQDIRADIELVDGHIIFFMPKRSFGFGLKLNLAELKQQYQAVHALFGKLESTLDTFRFETIGTHSHSL